MRTKSSDTALIAFCLLILLLLALAAEPESWRLLFLLGLIVALALALEWTLKLVARRLGIPSEEVRNALRSGGLSLVAQKGAYREPTVRHAKPKSELRDALRSGGISLLRASDSTEAKTAPRNDVGA